MSVPDNSRPKAPPSLLADAPAKPAGAPASGTPNGSRILANLEGRVAPPAAPAGKTTQRSSKAAGLVALLVIGAGAFGAWHWMSRTPSGAANTVATSASAAVVAASATQASQAIVANASKSAPEAASASHAATIVADDDAANAKSDLGNAASATGDNDRLSRALADGAASGANASAAPAAQVAQAAQAAPEKHAAAHKHESADAKHPAANEHKNESKTRVAQTKKAHATGKSDDSDADLLAVLVARTNPSEAKQAGTRSSKGSAKSSESSASLAQQVKACSERGFFEDQLCRWRVCDGHWGKDPACPQAAKASAEH